MNLSKDSIISRHFSKKMFGGLDEFEVRDFLHVLAEEIRHLSQLAKNQSQKIAEQDKVIEDYKDREHLLKSSISSAQEVADRITKEAGDQGKLIVEKAQGQSEALINNARHSLQSVYNDIADLRRLHLQFKTGLKATLQAQLELVEQTPLFSESLAHNQIDSLEDQSVKTEENLNDLEENLSEEQEDKDLDLKSEPADAENDGLSSLKESLKSLDKDFS